MDRKTYELLPGEDFHAERFLKVATGAEVWVTIIPRLRAEQVADLIAEGMFPIVDAADIDPAVR